MPRSERSTNPLMRNVLALLVASVTVGIAHLNLDPFCTGGEGGGAKRANAAPPRMPPPPELPTQIPASSELVAAVASAASPSTKVADDPSTLRGVWALKMAAALLEKGCHNFSKVPDYTACMFKQERLNGALGDGQTIDLKVRHEPYSVYMKWQSGDRGRQLIYVHGQNDGNMLVQPGGIKGRLTGLLSLEPTGSLAMAESRYPITKAGLLQLGHTILEYQHQDLERGCGFTCELRDHQEFEGRACYLYHINYESPEIHSVYRKSLIYVDKELSLPICVKNYTWGKDVNPETIDEETLIEFYAYTDLKIEQELSASDFDRNNRDYKLRVR
ncbi:DUF1571 domain-containing protein [Planctomicrobium piriforme]|uniref:DUF1571 domain-containing protein n=1 Tax=Planctomicrobium piriforme TaxID=1576369 RepID=A0A1I3JZG3_9PLAN|nr:DUF1571 domain-containing protein [Planctomicrobium piriforme]SFI65335.1 Protein of unknown function [Planctomicrobium piriforme]